MHDENTKTCQLALDSLKCDTFPTMNFQFAETSDKVSFLLPKCFKIIHFIKACNNYAKPNKCAVHKKVVEHKRGLRWRRRYQRPHLQIIFRERSFKHARLAESHLFPCSNVVYLRILGLSALTCLLYLSSITIWLSLLEIKPRLRAVSFVLAVDYF